MADLMDFDISIDEDIWLSSILPCVDVTDFPASTTHECIVPCGSIGDSFTFDCLFSLCIYFLLTLSLQYVTHIYYNSYILFPFF